MKMMVFRQAFSVFHFSVFIAAFIVVFIKFNVANAASLAASTVNDIDCNTVRERFQCPADVRYPLHLSFDDGPARETADVLDVLKRESIPATFFILGEKIDCEQIKLQECSDSTEHCQALRECEARVQIVKRTLAEGHLIGSHSYQHLRYTQQAPALMRHHFEVAMAVTAPYMNTTPPLFRLPYGDGWFNRAERPDVLETLNDVGFKHIAWDMSAFDWNVDNQQGDKIMANIMDQMCSRQRGGIALFHDGVDDQMHQGRLFTTQNLGSWIAPLRCVADFKPLDYFIKDLSVN